MAHQESTIFLDQGIPQTFNDVIGIQNQSTTAIAYTYGVSFSSGEEGVFIYPRLSDVIPKSTITLRIKSGSSAISRAKIVIVRDLP